MKNYLLILLFTGSVYCQDISYVKTLDTIFVNFKEGQFQIKTVLPANSKGFQEKWYTIDFGNNDHDYRTVKFYFEEYISPEKREVKIQSDVRIEKETFLRKHKEQIIGIEFLKKYDVCALKEAFFGKVIYIIDMEKGKKKPTLYEVDPFFSCFYGE